MDLSCILRSLQATDDKTRAKHFVLKAIASVEGGRPITRTPVIHLSGDAADIDARDELPQGIRMLSDALEHRSMNQFRFSCVG